MSSIGIKTLSLVSSNPGVTLQEGVSINGKPHKLLKIKLGFEAHMEIEVFFTSIMATTEIRNKAKWIWAIQDDTTKEWTLNGWTDPKDIPIEINGEMTTQYADSPRVLMTTTEEHCLGNLYWLEAFVHYPEMPNASIPKGVYVTFEDSPMLKKACFSDIGFCNFTAKELQYIPVTQYGKTINLFLSTYKLPDPNLRHHNYGSFKVTIFSKKTGEAVSEEELHEQNAEGVDSFLGTTKISIVVSEEWRTKIDHKEKTEEEFYAEITPIFNENKNATLASKGTPYRPMMGINRERFESAEAPNDDDILISYYQPKRLTLGSSYTAARVNSKRTEYEETELDTDASINTFKVIYNTGKEILRERSNKVGNQIASVLDTKHECIPADYECKFTAISLKDPDRKEAIYLLKENDDGTVNDTTELPVTVIAGDEKKKEVTITLEELSHAATPVECLKIERYHEDAEAVWGMTKALEQLQWIEEKDVNINENVLKLALKYHFIKSYDARSARWLGDTAGNAVDSVLDFGWILKYLDLWNTQPQSYFVPVSTCRYPNQKIKIDVYPDVEWYVNFKFNSSRPAYVKQDRNYKSRSWDKSTDKFKRGAAYGRERSLMRASAPYSLEVAMGISFDGKKQDITFSNEHPIFRLVNYTLKAYEGLNELLQSDQTKAALPQASASKMSKRVNRGLPLRIEVHRPSFSAGVYCRYEESKQQPNQIGWFVEGVFSAAPLLSAEGRLDLLFFAQFIPVAGQFIAALNRIIKGIEILSFGAINIDYYIDLVVGAAVNLEVKPMAYHSIDGLEGPGISVESTFEIGLEAGGSVTVDMFDIEGQGKIHAEGKAKFKAYISYNNRSKECPAQFDFEGLEALIYIRFSAKRNKGKKGEDENDTPHKIPLLSGVEGPKIELFKF